VALILVVDDEPAVRSLCKETLSGLGHRVAEAADGEAAMAAYARLRPDAVLMDVGLGPGIDGLAAADAIARRDPSARIGVLTASRLTAVAVEAARLGAREYLSKPFTLAELQAVVGRLLA
jgi:CheY-like chemotaxis protein